VFFSSVSAETGYKLDNWGFIPSRGNDGTFSVYHCIQTSSGIHLAFYPMVPGVKWPQNEADNSPPSSAEVKNA
jgi:hypothetical protein